MSKVNKISLIGGIVLLVFMLIQINYDRKIQDNFNEFQSNRFDIVKGQLNSNGISEYQASLIAGAIRDETSMLASTVFSNSLMHSYMTTMTGIILLMLVGYAVKKVEKE